jgi:hypothetical protein
MASRGEVDGPRVEAADAAMSYHRLRRFLIDELAYSPKAADAKIDDLLNTDVGVVVP